MNRKVVTELKKLAEYYTTVDKPYDLGNGLFSPPRFSKRTYTFEKTVTKKKVKKYMKKPLEEPLEKPLEETLEEPLEKPLEKPKIRIGKDYQAEIPSEPDNSSIDRGDILII